ncbi:MAG: MCE family protein [Chitinophagales bacterium]|nr:MCE family protein [Bacteroidota bacterium]MBP8916143.1 MCE family protein [Chitinophagales bacterium]MBP9220131.1 MCE family protein [Chitinophagales bacterium]MBP9794981.1 MCE family protein [Chitinophagales bacterium]
MKKILPILILIIASCNNTYEVSLQFDSVDGIKKGTPVAIDGFMVGKVKDMYINEKNSVITVVQIDNEIELYADATFRIRSGFSGEGTIVLITGDSGPLLDHNKVIKGISKENILINDSTGHEIGAFLKSIFNNNTKQDSILEELKKLNEDLDKLEKE